MEPRFCAFCFQRVAHADIVPDPYSEKRIYCSTGHRNLFLAGQKPHTVRHWHHNWFIPVYLLIAGIVLAWGIHKAFGEPPKWFDSNSPDAQYFLNLKQPDTGVGCCNQSDCHYFRGEWKVEGYHYWVLLNAGWTQVPDEKVIKPNQSPRGEVVLCYLETKGYDPNGHEYPVSQIFCFSPAWEI